MGNDSTDKPGWKIGYRHTYETSRRAFLFISNGGRFTRLNRVDLDSHFLFIKKRSCAETKSLFIDPKQLALVVWPSKC